MGAWLRSFVLVLAMAVVGFLGAWQAMGLVSSRGALGPTILQSQSPFWALFSIITTVGVASIIGGLVARMTTAATGMFVLGFSIYAMAMKLSGVTEFVIGGGNIPLLTLEAVLLGMIVYVGAIVVFIMAGSSKDCPYQVPSQSIAKRLGMTILISLAILPIVWLIAASSMKGQIIGATIVGGITVGILARLFAHSVQPIIFFALPIVIGGLGYLAAMIAGPVDDIALTQRMISGLLLPMPIEYAAGAVMGVAIGLGWAASFVGTPKAATARS